MRYAVIDTNVLVVANGGASHVDNTCRFAAEEALQEVQQSSSLVLDDRWEMLGEYSRRVDGDGRRDAAGDLFFKWAASSAGVRRVRLTPDPERGYREFPTDPRLEHFDREDRKFVAATIVSGVGETDLVNAVDSDYSQHGVALGEAGVVVRELCVEHLPTTGHRRSG